MNAPPKTPAPQQFATLAEAMGDLLANIADPHKNQSANIRSNFSYKYADLSAVLQAIRPLLKPRGLWFTQTTQNDETGALYLETKLGHVSGETICSKMPIVLQSSTTNYAQSMGAMITYMRRYSLSMIFGLASDDDDDANTLTTDKPTATPTRPKPEPEQVKSDEFAERSKALVSLIKSTISEGELETVLRQSASFVGNLAKERPNYHAKLINIIDEQRASFKAQED